MRVNADVTSRRHRPSSPRQSRKKPRGSVLPPRGLSISSDSSSSSRGRADRPTLSPTANALQMLGKPRRLAKYPMFLPARLRLTFSDPLLGSPRNRDKANRFRKAVFSAAVRSYKRRASSRNTTSNTQCRPFSMPPGDNNTLQVKEVVRNPVHNNPRVPSYAIRLLSWRRHPQGSQPLAIRPQTRALFQLPQALDFGGIGPDRPRAPAAADLTGVKPALLPPAVQGVRRQAETSGQFVQPPLVRRQYVVRGFTPRHPRPQAEFVQQSTHHRRSEASRTLRRSEAVAIEDIGDRGGCLIVRVEHRQPGREPWPVRLALIPTYRPSDAVFLRRAPGPFDPHDGAVIGGAHPQHHPVDQQPGDLASIRRRGRRRVP